MHEYYQESVDLMKQHRNTEQLLINTRRIPNIPNEYRTFIEAMVEYVGPWLLMNPRIQVTPLPAFLIPNPKDKSVIPATVFIRLLKGSVDLPIEEDFTTQVQKMGQHVIRHYEEMFLYEPIEYTPDIVVLYTPVYCTEFVTDPASGVKRLGFMTRYAKYKF